MLPSSSYVALLPVLPSSLCCPPLPVLPQLIHVWCVVRGAEEEAVAPWSGGTPSFVPDSEVPCVHAACRVYTQPAV